MREIRDCFFLFDTNQKKFFSISCLRYFFFYIIEIEQLNESFIFLFFFNDIEEKVQKYKEISKSFNLRLLEVFVLKKQNFFFKFKRCALCILEKTSEKSHQNKLTTNAEKNQPFSFWGKNDEFGEINSTENRLRQKKSADTWNN